MPRKSSEQSRSKAPDPAELTYEQAVTELESIIERIELGQIGLEESLEAYQRGSGLIQRCRSILDAAEQQVEQLAAAMEGEDASGGVRKSSG